MDFGIGKSIELGNGDPPNSTRVFLNHEKLEAFCIWAITNLALFLESRFRFKLVRFWRATKMGAFWRPTKMGAFWPAAKMVGFWQAGKMLARARFRNGF